MIRLSFAIAFFLGAIAIAWMSSLFAGSNHLALLITLVIGIVYLVGVAELLYHHRSMQTLKQATEELTETPEQLGNWLLKLAPGLRTAVQMRIEGERSGLPAPAISPFLVGLLVMLGLLGTFVGMVETLSGAVVALDESSELDHIRAGLAAPIEGLGLAFGTSIAGVAGSAALGLMLTLCRRHIRQTVRQLDNKSRQFLFGFSRNHEQQQTFAAIQTQSQALPELAAALQESARQLTVMGESLTKTLIDNQQQFHQSVESSYSALADRVDQSLQHSLSHSAQLMAENIRPIVTDVMTDIRTASETAHDKLQSNHQQQGEAIQTSLAQLGNSLTEQLGNSVTAQADTNTRLGEQLENSLNRFNERFDNLATATQESHQKQLKELAEQLAVADNARLRDWSSMLESLQANSGEQNQQLVSQVTELLQTVQQGTEAYQANGQQLLSGFETALQQYVERIDSLSETTLAAQQQQATSLLEQQAQSDKQRMADLRGAIEQTQQDYQASMQSLATNLSQVMTECERLVAARAETESQWLDQHSKRLASLTEQLRSEMGQLRDDEQRRGDAAVQQLADLQTQVSDHLSQLGQSLEDPMTRLIETASEAPKAAAEVISQLQSELTANAERDQQLLVERKAVVSDLNELSSSLAESVAGQQKTINQLSQDVAEALSQISERFNEQVTAESGKLSDAAGDVTASAVEVATLGDVFGQAVGQFNDGSKALMENLTRIESALEQSQIRSNEQLEYFVAQARELIDHNVLSQQDIIVELRKLSRQTAEVS